MDIPEIEVLKTIFANVSERVDGLTILNIKIKKGKEGDVEVSYSTSNTEKRREHKEDEEPKPKPKPKAKAKGKPILKKPQKNKIKNGTDWGNDTKIKFEQDSN